MALNLILKIVNAMPKWLLLIVIAGMCILNLKLQHKVISEGVRANISERNHMDMQRSLEAQTQANEKVIEDYKKALRKAEIDSERKMLDWRNRYESALLKLQKQSEGASSQLDEPLHPDVRKFVCEQFNQHSESCP